MSQSNKTKAEAALRVAQLREAEALAVAKAATEARVAAMAAVLRAPSLEPCPFCGEVIYLQVLHTYVGNIHHVLCTCGVVGPDGDTTQEARDLWNKRAVQDGE